LISYGRDKELSNENYDEWVDRLYSKLPKTSSRKERFEAPKPQHILMGNRTFIKNFKQLCSILRRDEQHMLRIISKELATAGTVEGEQAVFQGRFNAALIGKIVGDYIKEFVICTVCKSPDTRIVREERFRFLICDACGAKSSVRSS